jgi:hypothetical protein
MQFEPNAFEPVLASGEAVTWTGRPHFVPYLISGLPILVFGCLWGAFDLNMIRTMPAREMGFAIPFFALHLFPFWGAILYMLWLLTSFRNVVYAITNQRLILRGGAFAPSFKSYDFKEIDQLTVSSGPFESMVGAGSVQFATGKTTNRGVAIFDRIRAVDQAYDVFKQLREAWEKSRGTAGASVGQGS